MLIRFPYQNERGNYSAHWISCIQNKCKRGRKRKSSCTQFWSCRVHGVHVSLQPCLEPSGCLPEWSRNMGTVQFWCFIYSRSDGIICWHSICQWSKLVAGGLEDRCAIAHNPFIKLAKLRHRLAQRLPSWFHDPSLPSHHPTIAAAFPRLLFYHCQNNRYGKQSLER